MAYARTGRVAAIAGVVLALLLAACGGGSEPSDSATAPAAANADQSPASPLEAELGFASDPGRRQYQLIGMQQQADEGIVQCMRQAGFFYAVGSASDQFRAGAFVGDESRDFATTNGLGITTSFSQALAADARQPGPDSAATNLDYVASLTAEQAVSYDTALVGVVDPASTSDSFQPSGCWGQAFTDIVRVLALIDEFDVELESLNARLNSDPRAAAFQQDWSACMDDAGYRFANETAMADDVYARLLDVELVQTETATQVASTEALDDLLLYEQQVAVASFDCRQSFAADFSRLRFDYEREFLDDNRFRIAALTPDTP